MIGERCNVAGVKLFKEAVKNGNWDGALRIASQQVRCCGLNEAPLHAASASSYYDLLTKEVVTNC